MTTSNDGFHGVAYGKFRKKVLRKMTPYDQPAISITNSNPNNTSKSGFLSRLIYLVTCAFWKRNPEEAPVTEVCVLDEYSNHIYFTRYDIEHLKKSLHLRTTRSHVGEGDKANIYNNSHVLRLKASISGPLNKHTVKGIKPISIPRPTTSLMIPLNQLVTFRVKLKARRSRSSVLYDLGSGGPMHKFGPKSYFVPSKRLLLRSSQPLLINLKGQMSFDKTSHTLENQNVLPECRELDGGKQFDDKLHITFLGFTFMISMSSQKFFSWPGTNEEQRNLANISAASEISNLETMPKQKTFRYDIEHLKKSLHLRTTRSDVGEGDKANIYNNAHVLRLKASISGPLNKHTVKGIKPISFQEPSKRMLPQLLSLQRLDLAAEQCTEWSRSFVLYDLGSGGPMHRIRPKANFHPTSLLISSQPAWELEGSNGSKMARKRRSSVLDDQDWLVRWVEFGQKLSLFSRKFSIRATTQMASKILEHLERTSPKEKNSSSRVAGTTEKSANKLTSNLALGSLDKVESSKFLLSSQNNQKSEGSAPTTNASSTLALRAEPRQKKPAFQMSVHEYFEVLDDDNHSTARVQGNAPTTNAASTLALPAEPPQKKPAFQMSVPEDFDVLDDDNHSTAPVQVNAPTTYAARSLALPRIYLEYDDPPQKKLRLSFSIYSKTYLEL
ncbi:hypothetical protein Tco_1265747 [Tanacetum coccineum]